MPCFFTPKGLHTTAQGCRVLAATLGEMPQQASTPKGLHQPSADLDATLSGLADGCGTYPRVAASTQQPWAVVCNPFGVNSIGFKLAPTQES